MKRYITTLYFFLIFYLAGVFAMENEVNYRTWLYIGTNEFPMYHQELEKLLQPFLMIPLTLSLILSWLLAGFKNIRIVRILFFTTAVLLSFFTIISLTLMVPIHGQLSEAHNTELIQQLILNNARYRSPVIIAIVVLNVFLLFKLLSGEFISGKENYKE